MQPHRTAAALALALAALGATSAHARDGSDDSSDDNLLATVPASACALIAGARAAVSPLGGAVTLAGGDEAQFAILRCPLPLARSGSSGGDRLATLQVSYLDSDGPGEGAGVAVAVTRVAVAANGDPGFTETPACPAWASSGPLTGATATIPCASAIGQAYFVAHVTLSTAAGATARAAFLGLRASR